jgi:hypothetical protein
VNRPPNYDELVRLGLLKPPALSRDSSLGEARAYVRERLDVGVECPCCGQYAKRYVRKLNSGMARVLIRLCSLSRGDRPWESAWVSIKKLEMVSREVHKLAYWGLVVTDENEDSTKHSSGSWKPTDKGYEFVWGRVTVPERVILFDGQVEGFEGEETPIWEALGKKFDYQELMSTMPGFSTPAVKSA